MTTAATYPADWGLPITAGQRKALFAAGRAHGLDIDDLRGLTPAGSVSALTRLQAASLLERLNRGTETARPEPRPRAPRRPKGVLAICTAAQRGKIEALRIDLGWTPEGLTAFLAERHHLDGRAMTAIDSTKDGAAVIELLKTVLGRTLEARRRESGEAQAVSKPDIDLETREG